MNQIFFNTTYNQMNAIYVNINIGPNVSPPVDHNEQVNRPEPNPHSSASLSSSSPSSSLECSPPTSVENRWGTGQVIPKGLANNAMFDRIRYKTEMCKNFIELGQCRFGEKCYYAHFAHELQTATYKHKNYKTQLCKPFHSDGFCDFGARCAFIHTKPNVYDIVHRLESFCKRYSAPPMPDINVEEELAPKYTINSKTEKRLKVFETLSSK